MEWTHASVRAALQGTAVAMLAWLSLSVAACDSSGGGGQGGASSGSTTSAASTTGGTGGAGGAGGGSTTTTTTGAGGAGVGGGAECPPAPSGPPPSLKLTQVAGNLSKPLLAIGAPGDTSRLYIVEQTGNIRILKDGAAVPTPFLSTVGLSSGGSDQGSERGLLGLAFHPGYAQNGRFFIYYTASSNGAITIAEYARSAANPDVADPQPVKTLVQITNGLHPWGNHNGGMLAFGPDGYLYAGVGDGGGAGDPSGHGQDTGIKLAKLLRLDVDNHPAAPPGNLPGGDPHVWDYGLRNPWRFSFDRCTGDLYIGDVGQDAIEEIDVEAAGQGHKNYGWNITEGTSCYGGGSCDMNGLTPPVVEYPHSLGCSITGGYVYRGSAIPNLVGTYFYGDYCTNRVWTIVWQDGSLISGPTEITADLQSNTIGNISSFGQDTRGELYIVDLAGRVFRIDAE